MKNSRAFPNWQYRKLTRDTSFRDVKGNKEKARKKSKFRIEGIKIKYKIRMSFGSNHNETFKLHLLSYKAIKQVSYYCQNHQYHSVISGDCRMHIFLLTGK